METPRYIAAAAILLAVLALIVSAAPDRPVERRSVAVEAMEAYRNGISAKRAQVLKDDDREMWGDHVADQLEQFRGHTESGAGLVRSDSTGQIKVVY